MKVSPVVLPLTAAALWEGSRLVMQELPPIQKVRGGTADDKELRANVRTGEVVAGLTLLAVAGGVSYMTESIAPIVAAGGIIAVVVGLYEWALFTEGAAGSADVAVPFGLIG